METNLLIDHSAYLVSLGRELTKMGFTVDGRERTFTHKDMVEVTERAAKRTHTFLDLQDMIRFALSEGSPEHSMILFDDKAVALVLDRVWMENRSVFNLKKSDEWLRWLRAFSQNDLVDHLTAWGQMDTRFGKEALDEVLFALKKLQLAQTVTYGAESKDGRVISLNYTLDGGDPASGKLPREWILDIPLHQGMPKMTITVELSINMPKDDGGKPTFAFSCLRKDAYFEMSLQSVKATLEEAMGTNWLILKASV